MIDVESFHLVASSPTLDAEPHARDVADLLEFRMDMAETPLEQLAGYDGTLDVLVTNRPAWEGGEREEGPQRRDELLEAIDHPAVTAVDLELRCLDNPDKFIELDPVIDAAEAADVTVIVSYHDFEGTPSRSALVDLVHRGCQYGSIAKLATTPENPKDVLELLGVTQDVTVEGRTVATMAMGEIGSHTRAIAPLYGSKLSYAPVDSAAATAPGQFDLPTLSSLLDTFGVRSGRI